MGKDKPKAAASNGFDHRANFNTEHCPMLKTDFDPLLIRREISLLSYPKCGLFDDGGSTQVQFTFLFGIRDRVRILWQGANKFLGEEGGIFRIFSGMHVKNRVKLSTVRRKLLQLLAAVVLGLCVWGHVSELFDHWDNTFKTGNDIEYSTVIVVLIAGAVVRFVRFAVRVLTARLGALQVRPSFAAVAAAIPNSAELIGYSPPLPLRI